MNIISNTCYYLASLCALLLSLTYSHNAKADIYMIEDDEKGIVLSNLVEASLIDQTQPNTYTLLIKEGPEILKKNKALPNIYPYSNIVKLAAQETLLEPALIQAVIATESNNNTKAVSPRGAQGLMQLMPGISKRFNVLNPHDPNQNIMAGARYLQELNHLFGGNTALMLAAYNAGPNAVIKYGNRIPPYTETKTYVPRVLQLYKKYSVQDSF